MVGTKSTGTLRTQQDPLSALALDALPPPFTLHLKAAATMASTITVELLDALLSSGPARQQAEDLFKTVALKERIQGLVTILTSTSIQEGHILLACVLLRRDIATITEPFLKDLTEPLLQLFQKLSSAACRRQVGYCLVEVCSSLSLVSPQDSQAALQSILAVIDPLVRAFVTILVHIMKYISLLYSLNHCSAAMRMPFRCGSWPIWRTAFPPFSAIQRETCPASSSQPRPHSARSPCRLSLKRFVTWPLPASPPRTRKSLWIQTRRQLTSAPLVSYRCFP